MFYVLKKKSKTYSSRTSDNFYMYNDPDAHSLGIVIFDDEDKATTFLENLPYRTAIHFEVVELVVQEKKQAVKEIPMPPNVTFDDKSF